MLVAYTKIENDASNKTAGLGWMSLATNPSLVRRDGIDLILFLQSKARCHLVHFMGWGQGQQQSDVLDNSGCYSNCLLLIYQKYLMQEAGLQRLAD